MPSSNRFVHAVMQELWIKHILNTELVLELYLASNLIVPIVVVFIFDRQRDEYCNWVRGRQTNKQSDGQLDRQTETDIKTDISD